jgi:DNA (cytosine-5)-methyltransferase 1
MKTVQNETNGMPNKLHKPRTLHLFAGAGGGILGDILLGHHPVCAVEIDSYCQQVLSARQADGCLPWFPIFEDVSKFDGRPWAGLVDVVSGGFPCQDISCAGKGAGIDGERSGMWVEMARIIREVAPRYVFVENSPMLTSRGLGRVLGDLAEMGFNARWGVLGACDVGAPHKRERIWLVGDSASRNGEGRELLLRPGEAQFGRASGSGGIREDMADTDGERREHDKQSPKGWETESTAKCGEGVPDAQGKGLEGRNEQGAGRLDGRSGQGCESEQGWWESEPDVGRVAHGVAARVDRLKAIGNGQVPSVAALAWRILSED